MKEIQVALGARSYGILVDSGLSEHLGEYIQSSGKAALVTTPVINELYGEKVDAALGEYELILVPDGEEAKQWSMVEELLGKMLDAELDRGSTVVALGGGTVGDLAGFASSIYMRGIKVIQVPTTLLAMVDSSIGGKTAVNHPKGKNLVGSFHQPSKVLIDPGFLETLPLRELRSGFAEVIKYGVISDNMLFDLLESHGLDAVSRDEMVEVIARCVSIKAGYVEEDEQDRKGIRAALNYGHTVGHAIETISNHSVNHGEGVAMGMIAAAWIAKKHDLVSISEYLRIVNIVEDYGLPSRIPDLETSDVINAMYKDKKTEQGQIKFVLPTGIGRAPVLRYIGEETIRMALEENR